MTSLSLRFVTSTGPASKLISRGQLGSSYPTHVEWRMDDGRFLGAHLEGGVMIRATDYDAQEWLRQQVIDVPCSDTQLAAAASFLRGEIGKSYDFDAIAAMAAGAMFGLEREWRAPNSWFCSELIARALEVAGIVHPLPVNLNHVTPLMLYCVCGALTNVGAPASRSLLVATDVASR